MNGPLHGIKVIDLSLLLPGPLCSMYLGDMGAEVVKVENPRAADLTRYMGTKIKGKNYEETGFYLSLNRNKKAITLNLKKSKGREVLLKLLEDADVLLEGFRPDTLNKMGIGYAQLKEKFPKLIYCAISGYGANGPYKELAGHDGNYISYSGLLGITGQAGKEPVLPGFQVADIGGGTLPALTSILAALYAREKTGKGQFLDIGMIDGAFGFLSLHSGEFIASQEEPERGDLALSGGLPNYNVYKTKDSKYIMLGALEERFFRYFLRQINREELLEGFKYEKAYLDKIKPELEKIFLEKNRDDWQELFMNPNTCLSPVKTIKEAFEDEQLRAREMVVTMNHPKLGEVKMIGSPFKFSETPCTYRLRPPAYGEHTNEILQSAGLSPEEIQNLKDKRVI